MAWSTWPGLQKIEGGNGVGSRQLEAPSVLALERAAEDAEADEGDDPREEHEAASPVAEAGESFEHRRVRPSEYGRRGVL
jgi:hypothetical protein